MLEPSGKDAEKLGAALTESALAAEAQAKANAEEVGAMEAEPTKTEAAALKPAKDELGIYGSKL